KIEFEATTIWKFTTVILGILLIISILTGGFGSGNEITAVNNQQQVQAPTQQQAPEQPEYVDASADDDPAIGKDKAPITIIEFSDFQCPFCERFYSQTLPQVKANYIDTGKARLVYRDFPLSFHPNALPAAIAGECADEQGRFFEYHDMLFDNQAAWSPLSDTKITFVGYAKALGMDEKKFETCLADPKIRAEVQADENDGTSYGVSGTPSFFINGRLLVGAQPYAAFQQAIEEELSK
ncbi:MAG TPA: DsbA family protein, partial [Candidatus Nanoarchaeia archaeon]|nr:DsbA family protein [Candidatus Nanoarchaeia archaeon]